MLKKLLQLYGKLQNVILNRKVENYILLTIIVFFSILTISQAGLINDKIRPYISYIDVFEGKHIDEVDSLIQEGSLTLQLVNMSKEKDVKILINGVEVDQFDNKTKDIKVNDNSVVEIDGTKLKSDFTVRIISKSDNVVDNVINKEVLVQSNIKILTRVKLK